VRPRPPQRKGRPTSLSTAVGQVLGELGLDSVAQAHQIGQVWAAVVGEQVAAHCQPVGLRGDLLELSVDSPVWSQQLQLRKPEILAGLAKALGAGAPRELRFQVGYVRRRPPA
jgi:predicted nucleic acid-binding Zn ribbon protein